MVFTAGNVLTAAQLNAFSTTTVVTTGTITAGTGGFVGNASTASTAAAWTTGRTITLTGDVTGVSGSWTGSGNISFATTIDGANHTHTGAQLSAIPASDITAGTFGAGNYVAPNSFTADADSYAQRFFSTHNTQNPTILGQFTARWDQTSNPTTVGLACMYHEAAASKTFIKFEFYSGSAADGGGISSDGTTLQLDQPSDIRRKQNIRPVSDSWDALEVVNSIDVIEYERHGTTRAGFSAQQWETIPALVGAVSIADAPIEGLDDFRHLNEAAVIPYLVEAIQILARR